MRILITGGAGYLGGSVVDKLLQTEHEIVVYDNLLYEESYRREVPFIYGDIRDQQLLKKYLTWADIVIWLAAYVGDQACALDQPLSKEINSDSLKFLVDNFKKRIIFTSTCSVYGLNEEIVTENSKLNPLSHYAQTKLWAEEILKDSNPLILRLGTLFGVSNHFSRIRTDLVLNTLVMNAIAKKKLTVFGGQQYRPLTHVRDVAEIIVNSVNTNTKGIYNLHYKNVTIIELANLIKQLIPETELEITNTTFEDSRNYRVSSEKAKKVLNFNPTISLEAGILELKTLLDEKRIKNPFDDRYSNYLYLKHLGEKK